MARCTRWCIKGCGKKVVYQPINKKDLTPFECLKFLGGCGYRHTKEEVGYKRR